MATVTIGGRELGVKPATLGFLKRKLLPAKKALSAAKTEEETIDAVAELMLLYVGHNEGVTVDWLLDNVPEDTKATIDALRAAAGQAAAAGGSPGEAKSP